MPGWGRWPLVGAAIGGGGVLLAVFVMSLTPIGFAPELLGYAAALALFGASIACAVLGLSQWTSRTRTVQRTTPQPVRRAVLRGRPAPEGAEPLATEYARVSAPGQVWAARQLTLLYAGLVLLFGLNAVRDGDAWQAGAAALFGVLAITVLPTIGAQARRLTERAAAAT